MELKKKKKKNPFLIGLKLFFKSSDRIQTDIFFSLNFELNLVLSG
jgi:hypothetical protein|tara:strand:- start:612 stop:746 length:135 start_codon:yes stop_codon:yes gene_type:complete